MGKRIILTTFGSLGDLHPHLALARALLSRGHTPTIAAAEAYRAKVESLGISFAPVGPNITPDDPELMRDVMDLRKGPEVVQRRLVMPYLRSTYEELGALLTGADLLVCSELSHAGRVAGDRLGVPWVSTVLAPFSMFSTHDPSVMPLSASWLPVHRMGRLANRLLFALARRATREWGEPIQALRQEVGLPRGPHPIIDGTFSSRRVIAMFSPRFGPPQADWPAAAVAAGFPFFDEDEVESAEADRLERFLVAGPPPLVFTLGSSAVHAAGGFYEASVAAARTLGERAVLLVGSDPRNRPAGPLPDSVLCVEYAPHGKLFARARAVVHQGGIGTTAQALRSGHPMIVVPFGFDQPDNAARAARLGVARTVRRDRFTEGTITTELRALLADGSYAQRAAEVGAAIDAEDGLRTACEWIEAAA
ncbi:MAG: glycosyltransferase [Chloroflexota bacterium]